MSSGNFDKKNDEFLLSLTLLSPDTLVIAAYYLYCLFYFIIRRSNLENGKKSGKISHGTMESTIIFKRKRIFNNKTILITNCLKRQISLFFFLLMIIKNEKIFLIKLISFFINSHLLIYLSQSGSSRIIFFTILKALKESKKKILKYPSMFKRVRESRNIIFLQYFNYNNTIYSKYLDFYCL